MRKRGLGRGLDLLCSRVSLTLGHLALSTSEEQVVRVGTADGKVRVELTDEPQRIHSVVTNQLRTEI